MVWSTMDYYQIITMKEDKFRKGLWFEEEDELLTTTVSLLGERRWDALAKASGLRRSGKSCRLRWMNYLRPNLKHGQISTEEEQIILQLHQRLGNKWSKIARGLPGRTDNEIKNYWRRHLRKKTQVHEQSELQISSASDTVIKADNSSVVFRKDEISNFEFINSPYETQLSDWMSPWWSYEENEIKNQNGNYYCCCLDLCYCYTTWNISKDSDTAGILDSSNSIWELD